MFTITKEEVAKNKQYSLERTQSLIEEYVDRSFITFDTTKLMQRVQLMIVNNAVLQSWEQGDFTNSEYINYITSKGYLNLIDKIRNV